MRACVVLGVCAALASCARTPPATTTPPARSASPVAPADDRPREDWSDVQAIVAEAPPWEATNVDTLARPAVIVPRLARMMEAPNEITDEDAWLARNGIERPGTATPSRPLPDFFRDAPRSRVIEQAGWTLGIYGVGGSGRYLLLAGDGRRLAFDFANYWIAPAPGAEAWPQDLLWAAVAGDHLYVAHAHLTYAESTGGMNGYLTAVDLDHGSVLWRSRPRVANARTFEVVNDAIISGYGFTAEADFLFVIDRFHGRVLHEERIRTAPTWIVRQGERLFVRAYDADYVFAVL